jgi:orotate phosphoribosyltransferase
MTAIRLTALTAEATHAMAAIWSVAAAGPGMLVDDVITAGTAIRESMEIIQAQARSWRAC